MAILTLGVAYVLGWSMRRRDTRREFRRYYYGFIPNAQKLNDGFYTAVFYLRMFFNDFLHLCQLGNHILPKRQMALRADKVLVFVVDFEILIPVDIVG